MRHDGRIVRLAKNRGFGFIQSDADNREYFFHFSDVDGSRGEISRLVAVEFTPTTGSEGRLQGKEVRIKIAELPAPAKRPALAERRNSYDGPTIDLTDEDRRRALSDISKWKLEARLDDLKRYFFAIPELNYITTGEASYIIGRKGTGKTALVQYLSQTQRPGQAVTKLTFKNFPFNELYTQANSVYKRPNQYITVWKLIIYSAACRLIANGKNVDPLIKQKIEKAFPPTDSDNLGTIVGKWISGDFGISILGSGINVAKWFKEKRPITMQDKVENLEAFVKKHMPSYNILILFDELDEDYKEMFENYGRSEYLDLLTSLFKAVQDVRSTFRGDSNKLYPVIFLRDDIYDLIQDSDKNKWRDLEVDLSWTDEGIRALLAHRLSKVINTDCEDFDTLWYSLFEKNSLVYSKGRKEIASFDYIKMSTQGRPRDYINYLKECALIELKRSSKEISEETIKDADKEYSNYLRKELIDEIHGIIPDIATVLSIFSEARKWILSIEEFKRAYLARMQSGTLSIKDVEFVLRTLFYFSVIGNVVRVGIHIFRHERPAAQLNFKERIIVHRGLMKSLQII